MAPAKAIHQFQHFFAVMWKISSRASLINSLGRRLTGGDFGGAAGPAGRQFAAASRSASRIAEHTPSTPGNSAAAVTFIRRSR